MKKPVVYLDTETTGIEDGRLVELAFLTDAVMTTFRVKPPIPIEIEAMAIHHITPNMVEELWTFQQREDYKGIKLTLEEGIVVAHNAPFDIRVLNREGIFPETYIDTKRVAMHLFPNAPKYNLQFLRYWFGIHMESVPHSADGDVRVLEAVFKKLHEQMIKTHAHDPIGEMIALTKTPVLMHTMPFGKHAGKSFADIHREDPSYFKWLMNNAMEGKDEDFVYTINFWINKKESVPF